MGVARKSVRVLLGSGGIATEERLGLYRELVTSHFEGSQHVLFIPYASNDQSGYTSRMQNFLGVDGPILVGIETLGDPVEAVRSADAIYVGGGNSFLLIRELHDKGIVGTIRERVLDGVPYLGVSAGSNVACPTMMTTNDMPIVHPSSFESMGVVPFQINPHYHPGKILFREEGDLVEHHGESRARRIEEFHREDGTPVLGMWEGSFVHWDGTHGSLSGRATSFRRGEPPIDIHDGSRFDGNLELAV